MIFLEIGRREAYVKLTGGDLLFHRADVRDGQGAIFKRIVMKGDYYWAERGHDVRVNLVNGGFLASMRSARTDVRSNLINGVPTRSTENFA